MNELCKNEPNGKYSIYPTHRTNCQLQEQFYVNFIGTSLGLMILHSTTKLQRTSIFPVVSIVYTYSKSSFNLTCQSCENRIARLVVNVFSESQVRYRASPCGICGGQSGNGTGFSLPPSTSDFPYQISCHQCSILIHSSIIDAI
jgi:hypothetical protein